jgi:hypothetical protein
MVHNSQEFVQHILFNKSERQFSEGNPSLATQRKDGSKGAKQIPPILLQG